MEKVEGITEEAKLRRAAEEMEAALLGDLQLRPRPPPPACTDHVGDVTNKSSDNEDLSGNNLRAEDESDMIFKLENVKREILSVSTVRQEKEIIANENVRKESDEEVIEVEFERGVEKLHRHNPCCPNCRS